MLGNKVSPATLYLTSDSSLAENVIGSSAEDSQYSQTSLFGSDAPSSMELFSQPSNSQSQPQLPPDSSCQRSVTTLIGTTGDKKLSSFQPEIPLSRKFYLKYLNSRNKQADREITPDQANSKPAPSYETWKTKQMESQHFFGDVQKAVKEGLKEVKEELGVEMTGLRDLVLKQTDDTRERTLSARLVSGQEDLMEHIAKVQDHLLQRNDSLRTLSTRVEALESSLSVRLCRQLEEVVEKRSQEFMAKVDNMLTQKLSLVLNNNLLLSGKVSVKEDACDQAVPCQENTSDCSNEHSATMCGNSVAPKTQSQNKELSLNNTARAINLMDCVPLAVEKSNDLLSQRLTDQSGISTACDIDLTQQSPSMCSQVISQLLVQNPAKRNFESSCNQIETTQTAKKRKLHKNSVVNHLASQQTKRTATSTTPQRQRSKRRSQRLQQRAITHFDDDDDSSDYCKPTSTKISSVKLRRRFGQPYSQKSKLAMLKTVHSTASPKNALDNCFYSQTSSDIKVEGSHGTITDAQRIVLENGQKTFSNVTDNSSKQDIIGARLHHAANTDQLSVEKFQRSTEAAKRRVKVIAELSNSTSEIREISASIKKQQACRQYAISEESP